MKSKKVKRMKAVDLLNLLFKATSESLTEKEELIIQELGEDGPQTGYYFHLGGVERTIEKRIIGKGGTEKEIKKPKMSTATWISAKKTLTEKKDLIRLLREEPSEHSGFGRNKKIYWLTQTGIIKAIQLGVSPSKVLMNAEKYYPNETSVWILFRDVCQELGEEKFEAYFKIAPEILLTLLGSKWPIGDRKLYDAIGEDGNKIIRAVRRNPYNAQIAKELFLEATKKKLGWGVKQMADFMWHFMYTHKSKVFVELYEDVNNRLLEIAKEKDRKTVGELIESVIIPEWLESKNY